MSVGPNVNASPGGPGNRSISQSLHLEPGRYHRLMQVIGRFRPAAGEDQLAEARDLAVEWLQTILGVLVPPFFILVAR